jgi:hypothetical protein
MFVAGYQEAPTAQMRGMGTLGEGPNRNSPSAPTIDTKTYCRNITVTDKIDRPKPAWIPADWGNHYDTLYNVCYGGHDGQTASEYGDVIGYRIDPGNSTYQYYDPNGKFLYAVPRAKGGIPAPIIAAAIAVIAPPLAAAVNEYLTGAEIFTDAATTQAVSNGIANTTLQVASGTPIKKAITGNVTSTLIQTQSAEATNTVDSVLNNPDVSAAIVTTAGIIVQNQTAGKSTAAITKAATASITSPAAVTAVTTAAANIPAKVTTMTDTTSAQDQAVLEFAKAEIAAGRTLQQITDDIKTYFNKTFTTKQVSDYLAANNLTIQAAQTATGLSSNTLIMLGGGLLLVLLLRGKK